MASSWGNRKITEQDVEELVNTIEARMRHSAHQPTASVNTSRDIDVAQQTLPSAAIGEHLCSLETPGHLQHSKNEHHTANNSSHTAPLASKPGVASSMSNHGAGNTARGTSTTMYPNFARRIGNDFHNKRLRAKDLWDRTDEEEENENAALLQRGRAFSETSRASTRRESADLSNVTTCITKDVAVVESKTMSCDQDPRDAGPPDRRCDTDRAMDSYEPSPPKTREKRSATLLSCSMGSSDDEKIIYPTNTPTHHSSNTAFPRFNNLPGQVKDKILSLLLENDRPVEINTAGAFYVIVDKVEHLVSLERLNSSKNANYFLPLSDAAMQDQVKHRHRTMSRVGSEEWQRIRDYWRSRSYHQYSPYMTPALLFVSKDIHSRAARIFYGSNTSHFTNDSYAWPHLEAFLLTITNKNSRYIQSLRLSPPRWHLGVRRDMLEGAQLDASSPATRLVVVKKHPAEDRLLSAIATSTRQLIRAGTLESLRIDISYPDSVQRFIGSHPEAANHLIRMSDVDAHVKRKEKGTQMLKQLSDSMKHGKKPVLIVRVGQKAGLKPFREQHLAVTTKEANKYGWVVKYVI
ncbi:hypothetical protein Q7P37_011558 [Cladosporium fusiforme]